MLKRLIRSRRTAFEPRLGSDASCARPIAPAIEYALGRGKARQRGVVAGPPVAAGRSVVA